MKMRRRRWGTTEGGRGLCNAMMYECPTTHTHGPLIDIEQLRELWNALVRVAARILWRMDEARCVD